MALDLCQNFVSFIYACILTTSSLLQSYVPLLKLFLLNIFRFSCLVSLGLGLFIAKALQWGHARIQQFSWGGGGEGDQVSLTKKALTTYCFFLVLSLFYRSQMVNFKEIYHFSRYQRGSNIFQGGGRGPTFSRGRGEGSNCLLPIETHITCDFPGGGSGPPVPPPLWIRTWEL